MKREWKTPKKKQTKKRQNGEQIYSEEAGTVWTHCVPEIYTTRRFYGELAHCHRTVACRLDTLRSPRIALCMHIGVNYAGEIIIISENQCIVF